MNWRKRLVEFGIGIGLILQIGIALHFIGRNDIQWFVVSIPGVVALSWMILNYNKYEK